MMDFESFMAIMAEDQDTFNFYKQMLLANDAVIMRILDAALCAEISSDMEAYAGCIVSVTQRTMELNRDIAPDAPVPPISVLIAMAANILSVQNTLINALMDSEEWALLLCRILYKAGALAQFWPAWCETNDMSTDA